MTDQPTSEPSAYCEKHKRYHYSCPCMECYPDYYKTEGDRETTTTPKPTSEPSDLVKQIEDAMCCCMAMQTHTPHMEDCAASDRTALGKVVLIAADLEARLAATGQLLKSASDARDFAGRERDEARGRLEGIAKLVTPESGLPVLAKIYRLATEKGE